MTSYVGLDVSVAETSVCVLGGDGRVRFDHVKSAPLGGEGAAFARDAFLVEQGIECVDGLLVGHACGFCDLGG